MPIKEQTQETATTTITKTSFRCSHCSFSRGDLSACLKHEYEQHYSAEVTSHMEDLGNRSDDYLHFLHFEREEAFTARLSAFTFKEAGKWDGPGWYEVTQTEGEHDYPTRLKKGYEPEPIWFTGTSKKQQQDLKECRILFGFPDDQPEVKVGDQTWVRSRHFVSDWGISIEYAVPQEGPELTEEQIRATWKMWRGRYGYASAHDYHIE